MTKTYLLDANAALDFLEGGPGLPRLKPLFKGALERQNTVLMSVANLGEVFYHVCEQHGDERAQKAIG
jgi:predicted nucleic acid-binding protein